VPILAKAKAAGIDELMASDVAKARAALIKLFQSKDLRDIINKDYVRVNIWIKLQALYLLGRSFKGKSTPKEVLACLYHPHPLMQEAAHLLVGNFPKGMLLYDRLNLLRRSASFAALPEYKLIWVALLLVQRNLRSGEKYPVGKHEEAYLLTEGEVVVQCEDGSEASLVPSQVFISGIQTSAPAQMLEAHADSRMLYARKSELIEILLSDAQITYGIFG